MRVGLVTFYFPPLVRGGAHLSAYTLAKGLAQRGHEVHVFTARPPEEAKGGQSGWEYPGIQRHLIFPAAKPTTAWGQDRLSLQMGRHLRRYLSRENPPIDVWHAYGMDTIPAIVMNGRYAPTVATFNGYWATCPFWDHTDPRTHALSAVCGAAHLWGCVQQRGGRRGRLRRLAQWLYLVLSMRLRQHFSRQLDLLLPISQSMRAILLANSIPPNQMQVCYNMVDLEQYQTLDRTYLQRRFGIEPSHRIVLHAGRFAPYKGTECVIGAAPAILARHPDVRFVIVGQGANLPALEAQAHAAGLGDHVTFGDFIDPREMGHVYASSYLLLHTATWPEPFARGPVEGLAAGTAVIGTATGGTPELIEDGVTGLLIPPFSAQAIADATGRLLDDPALRDRLVHNGQELVRERFSIAGQIGCYESAYASVT